MRTANRQDPFLQAHFALTNYTTHSPHAEADISFSLVKYVLLRINEQRNILLEIRKRKANWIGHILRRNCLLQQIIEEKIKGQI